MLLHDVPIRPAKDVTSASPDPPERGWRTPNEKFWGTAEVDALDLYVDGPTYSSSCRK
jgi:hypothetical protein